MDKILPFSNTHRKFRVAFYSLIFILQVLQMFLLLLTINYNRNHDRDYRNHYRQQREKPRKFI